MTALTFTILTGAKTVEGSIRSRVNHSDVPATDVLADGEAWINERLRIEEQVQRVQMSLAKDIDKLTVPAGFLDPIALNLVEGTDNHGRIDRRAKYDVIERRNEDNTGLATNIAGPREYAVVGTELLFDAKADKAYTVNAVFYAAPTALSVSNETNIYTDTFRIVLRHAYLIYGFEFRKDFEQMTNQIAFATDEVAKLHVADDLNSRGGTYDTEVDYG